MTGFDSHDVESIARNPLVGIDGEGAEHRFDRYDDTVYVLQHGDVEHVEDLEPGQLPEWTDYVADERGWADLRLSDKGPFAALAVELADALEAGARWNAASSSARTPRCTVYRPGGATPMWTLTSRRRWNRRWSR
jgi:hypothetical protein